MKTNPCDGDQYTNRPGKYIDHLVLAHGADPGIMDTLRTRNDALLWRDVDEIHTALLEHAGLDVRLNQGYCVDQWFLWQQGMCQTYATALITARPDLRLGAAGYTTLGKNGWSLKHFFAHDDDYAYDSAGRHPLPYTGINGDFDHVELDSDPEAWGSPFSEEGTDSLDLVDAVRHSVRNGILVGWYQKVDGTISGITAA